MLNDTEPLNEAGRSENEITELHLVHPSRQKARSLTNWGVIQDGGTFEELLHAVLYAELPRTVLFGRPGRDAGQDARSEDGRVVYQAKYRRGMTMDVAVGVAKEELAKIKEYRAPEHPNFEHWERAEEWVLVGNFKINPNDDGKWRTDVVPGFGAIGIDAQYWSLEVLETKLVALPDIRSFFFEGRNRVFLGLGEAFEYLSRTAGGGDLKSKSVGRDAELQRVVEFAESDSEQILPVVGAHGVGKTRLLYESLLALSATGWRAYWALPESMARSDQWFTGLHGRVRTCVVVDDPEDPGLLNLVVEQLAASELQSWKVIVSCASERARILQPFVGQRHLAKTLFVEPLSENVSKKLLRSLLEQVEESWLYSVFQLSKGNPGWLCLIAKLTKLQALEQLPAKVDELARNHIDSALVQLASADREDARRVLRWLAVWGQLCFSDTDDAPPEVRYLVDKHPSLTPTKVAQLLHELEGVGLVTRWGLRSRMHAVEPLLVRDHIVRAWLFEETSGDFLLSSNGKTLLEDLISGQLPRVATIMRTLARLSRQHLGEPEARSVLKPVFESLHDRVASADVRERRTIVDLCKQLGPADPERALDLLSILRGAIEEAAADEEANAPRLLDNHTLLLLALPAALAELAEFVSEADVARRFLEEFRHYVHLEDPNPLAQSPGRSARDALARLLRKPTTRAIFMHPGVEIVRAESQAEASAPFVDWLLTALLDPERQYTEMISSGSFSIVTYFSEPGHRDWQAMCELRERLFQNLEVIEESSARNRVWSALAQSHSRFHSPIQNARVTGDTADSYRRVVRDDLERCLSILTARSSRLDPVEATHARKMWSWYLKHGNEGDLREIARECEAIFESASTWPFHEFFRWGSPEEVRAPTEQVAERLRTADDPALLKEFFDGALAFLEADRGKIADGADNGRVWDLAELMEDPFAESTEGGGSALQGFSEQVLQVGSGDGERPYSRLAWHFVVRLCQRHVAVSKSGRESQVEEALSHVLARTTRKAGLLGDMYILGSESLNGSLTKAEFECILEHEASFERREFVSLLATFANIAWDEVEERLDSELHRASEPSKLHRHFANHLWVSTLRFNWVPGPEVVGSVVNFVVELDLDGDVLGQHWFESLRDSAGFRFTLQGFVDFIGRRVSLEGDPRLQGQPLPFDFSASDWCGFDADDPASKDAFFGLCELALGDGYLALYAIPKFVAQLNPGADLVASFVAMNVQDSTPPGEIRRLAYLASSYADSTPEWEAVARSICERVAAFPRDDRESVFFALSRKDTPTLTAVPGQVPEHYEEDLRTTEVQLEHAKQSASPFIGYWHWRRDTAAATLKWQEARAEEDFRE